MAHGVVAFSLFAFSYVFHLLLSTSIWLVNNFNLRRPRTVFLTVFLNDYLNPFLKYAHSDSVNNDNNVSYIYSQSSCM